MRLQVFSDLHVGFGQDFTPEVANDVDVVVVAGDVCEEIPSGMQFLRAHIAPPRPIVMIAGNHEYYRQPIVEQRAAAQTWARDHDIVFLDDTEERIGGIRFIGATLWTDFRLHGDKLQNVSMAEAADGMNDYQYVRLQGEPHSPFLPDTALALHRISRNFLETALRTPHDGPTVVVTHHAPHPNSIAPRFAGKSINAAYITDLSELITSAGPDLWIHGHVHDSFDYRVGRTRVICNPKGYGRENPAFVPSLVVDLENL